MTTVKSARKDVNKPGNYRCQFVEADNFGVSATPGKKFSKKPCGRKTAKNGRNRYYCDKHFHLISRWD